MVTDLFSSIKEAYNDILLYGVLLVQGKSTKSSDGSAKNTEARFTGGVVRPRQSISRLYQYLHPSSLC